MTKFSKWELDSLKIYMHNYLLEIMKKIAYDKADISDLKNSFVEIAMFVSWIEKESEVDEDENSK